MNNTELRDKLLEDSSNMKWTTPDGWEIQPCIPVEYAMEIFNTYIHSHTQQQVLRGKIEEIKTNMAWQFCNEADLFKYIEYQQKRIKQLEELEKGSE